VTAGSPPSDPHYQPAGRVLEVSVGLVCAVCGSGLALLGAWPLYAVLRHGHPLPESPVLLPMLLLWALAALLLVFAWRLILNRARRWDGGLLSPLGLRIGGVIFLAGPICALFVDPSHLVHAAYSLAAAAACFALARRRERYLSDLLDPLSGR
jgi:hypothetical protein